MQVARSGGSAPTLHRPPRRAATARIRVDAEMCRCGFLFVQPSFARDVGLEPETLPPPLPLPSGSARRHEPPAALSVPVVDSASGSWIYAVLRQGAPAPTALTTVVGPAPPGAVAPARLCGLGARKGVTPGSVVRLTCAKGGQLSLAVERQTGQLVGHDGSASPTAVAGEGVLGARQGQGQGLQQGSTAHSVVGQGGGGQEASHFAQQEWQQGYGGQSGAVGVGSAGVVGDGRGPATAWGRQQPLQQGQQGQEVQGRPWHHLPGGAWWTSGRTTAHRPLSAWQRGRGRARRTSQVGCNLNVLRRLVPAQGDAPPASFV